MFNNVSSPIVVITSATAKTVFDSPQNLKNKTAAIKKARKDLKKAGFKI